MFKTPVKIYPSYFKEEENNKCCIKYLFWKVFKKLYKTNKEFISRNTADRFYSKSSQRVLQGQLGTQAIEALSYLKDIWVLRHSKFTWKLKYFGTWTLEAFYLADLLSSIYKPSITKVIEVPYPISSCMSDES